MLSLFLERARIAPICSQCRLAMGFRLPIRLSVTFRCFVQTNQHTIMRFSASNRTIHLVSGEVKFTRIFAGDHPQRDVKVRHFHVDSERKFDQQSAITWKRCKIGSKLVLITNRKLYASFRLVLKSVTLKDLERRNGCVVCVISPNLVAFGADCIKIVKDTPILSATKM